MYFLTLSISSAQTQPLVRLTEEEVKESVKTFTLTSQPADSILNKRFNKESEYQLVRNGSNGFVAFGQDKERLLQVYLDAVLPLELQELLPVFKPPDAESDAAIEEIEMIDSTVFPYTPHKSRNSPESFIRKTVTERLNKQFGIMPETEPELVDSCVQTLCNDLSSLVDYDLLDNRLMDIVSERNLTKESPDFDSDLDWQEILEEEFAFPKRGKATVHTDGSCIGNPGPGGWAAVIRCGGRKKELAGGATETTNNRMELMGVIEALEFLTPEHDITLFSDSKYVVDAINKDWVTQWQQNNRMNDDTPSVKNPDLWKRLLDLLQNRKVTFQWVKGHSGNPDNERCDQLAFDQSAFYEQKRLKRF